MTCFKYPTPLKVEKGEAFNPIINPIIHFFNTDFKIALRAFSFTSEK